jgi:8-oxo-dGTP pyrophosphatase MutT (NUDIX family)
MKTIIAAGGLVENEAGLLLMIFRRGKWDLPKGKLDDGETIEACALREVAEETGITPHTLGELIGKTYHQYFDKWLGEEVIKETWWYRMKADGSSTLVPQAEEDIEQIIWADEATVAANLTNSFPSIQDIIQQWKMK